jgi:predicted lipoprotein with Yx(FWY)xxD motif
VRRALLLGLAIATLPLTAAACGASSSNTTPSASGGGGVAVSARSIKGLGSVLVNGQGRTLYTFTSDKARRVTCTGNCAVVWTPLKVTGGQKPSVSGGVKASLLSSDPDPSGGRVVTYNGWPLYLYQVDQVAGTDHGQAATSNDGRWYVISPSGSVIKTPAKKIPSEPGTYCLSVTARIATPGGPVQVDQVKRGMVVWSTDRRGHRIRVKVLKVHRTHVPLDHMMVRLRLADGRKLLVSLGHPLPDEKPVASLTAGQRFEGSRVLSADRVRYGRPYTYDLLPAGPTHRYFADGVLLASTLAATRRP